MDNLKDVTYNKGPVETSYHLKGALEQYGKLAWSKTNHGPSKF